MGALVPAATSTCAAAPSRAWPLSAAMCACVALVVGMVSAINLAIPSLAAGDLHPTATELLWIVDGYVVVFACLLVPAGAVADRFGRKGTLLCGMAIFAAGTAICALAPSVAVLISGRVIAGVGAAAVLPTTLALLLGSGTPAERPRLIAVWASMTGVAAVLGNLGGGAAVQTGSWRALFAVTTPLAVVALAASARVAPRPPRHQRKIAVTGSLLLTAGCVALLVGLTSAPAGWTAPEVLAGLGAAVLLLGAWTVYELHSEHPVLDPRLFSIPVVRASALGMAVVFVGMFGLMYVNGQYLQYAKGYSVLGAGLRLLPMAAALWVAPRATVPVFRRFGARVTVGLGLAALAAGLFGASFVDSATPYPWYALCIVMIALGCGTATPPLSDGIMSSIPADRAGTGSGLQSVTRELGSALGVAIVGSILDARFTAVLPAVLQTPDAPSTVAAARTLTTDPAVLREVVSAFSQAMSAGLRTAAVVVLVIGALVIAWLPRRFRQGSATARNRRLR
ncbi:MAG: transporter [Pseudonocardia sp.]|nr:transporter [Pseudonocardia sp.]